MPRLRTITKQFQVKFSVSLIGTFILSSCASHEYIPIADIEEVNRQECYSISILNSSDELASYSVDEKIIHFTSNDLEFENDIIVFSHHTLSSKSSIILPAKKGEMNTYTLTDSIHGMYPLDETNPEKGYLAFSGNDYLTSFDGFLHTMYSYASETNDTVKYALHTENLLHFISESENSQMGAYTLLSAYSILKDFAENEKITAQLNRIEEIACSTSGVFYEKICLLGENSTNSSCKDHASDTLVLQSNISSTGYEMFNDHVMVVQFWATWCGPCKPQMRELSQMSLDKYVSDSVYFLCASIDKTDKLPIEYFSEHRGELTGVMFHKDNGCMEKNYAIVNVPTLLVFDKNHKLVARDPSLDELEGLIDSLLDKGE